MTDVLKPLSVDDPIEVETLHKFSELESTRLRLGGQLLDLESEKVKVLVSSRRIDEERQRLFEKVLMDRGIHPSTAVEIDANTGRIKLLHVPQGPEVQHTNGATASASAPAAAPAS